MMDTSATRNVTLTGAGGQIGYAMLFRIASGAMFGPDVPVRLRLLEIPQGLRAARGVALELEDCAFGLLESIEVTDDPARAFDGTNVALLVGARPRGPGMERADLLAANGAIFGPQGAALNAGAADDIRVVVVGNPANTNAMIASAHAPGIPAGRFTAMTRLDHNRALGQLAAKLRVPVSAVSGVMIWGNHSSSQVPDLAHATVADAAGILRPVPERLAELLGSEAATEAWIEDEFIPTVARRGAEIIEVRGSSSVGSAAAAAIDHVRDWVTGTGSEHTSVALASDGSYGVPDGLFCSFPVRSVSGDWRIVEGLSVAPAVQARIDASVAELEAERDAVAALGLLG